MQSPDEFSSPVKEVASENEKEAKGVNQYTKLLHESLSPVEDIASENQDDTSVKNKYIVSPIEYSYPVHDVTSDNQVDTEDSDEYIKSADIFPCPVEDDICEHKGRISLNVNSLGSFYFYFNFISLIRIYANTRLLFSFHRKRPGAL